MEGVKESPTERDAEQNISRNAIATTRDKEKNSHLVNFNLPLLRELHSRVANHPVYLTEVAYPSAPYFHNLPYFPTSEHHLQGLSAFCKYYWRY